MSTPSTFFIDAFPSRANARRRTVRDARGEGGMAARSFELAMRGNAIASVGSRGAGVANPEQEHRCRNRFCNPI
jgi:hypothetical protein